MALASYSDLQTVIATWLDRSDLTTYIPDFITLAEETIYRTLRVPAMEKALDLTIASGVIAVPTDYLDLKSAYLNASPTTPLERTSVENLYVNYPRAGTSGKPLYIAREGSNFVFGPYPDSNYNIKGIYYYRPAALSGTNTSNFLTTDYPSLLLFGSLVQAKGFLFDDPRIPIWDGLFRQAMAETQLAGRREKMSGSTHSMTMRPAP